jgi:hypothetical protein
MARLEVLIPDVEEEEYESLRSALLETLPGDHSATTYYHRLEVHLEVDPVDNPTVFTKQLARKVASKAEKICAEPGEIDLYYLCADASDARHAHVEGENIQYVRKL